jgi:hypothetical protein
MPRWVFVYHQPVDTWLIQCIGCHLTEILNVLDLLLQLSDLLVAAFRGILKTALQTQEPPVVFCNVFPDHLIGYCHDVAPVLNTVLGDVNTVLSNVPFQWCWVPLAEIA